MYKDYSTMDLHKFIIMVSEYTLKFGSSETTLKMMAEAKYELDSRK